MSGGTGDRFGAPAAGATAAATVTRVGKTRHFATPAARRAAQRSGVDLSAVRGVAGRVYRRHVLAAAATVAAPTGSPAAPPAAPAAASAAVGGFTVLLAEVDYQAVERARRAHQAGWRAVEGFALTHLPFVLRAVVEGLREVPALRSPVAGAGQAGHRPIHLAVVTEVGAGGSDAAPVLRHADDKRLRGLARELHTLTGAPDAGRPATATEAVAAAEVTLTVTVVDTGGVLVAPAPTEPAGAVLSVGAVAPTPVAIEVEGSHGLAVHPVGRLALTFDHRLVPVPQAVAFLSQVTQVLEAREWTDEL